MSKGGYVRLAGKRYKTRVISIIHTLQLVFNNSSISVFERKSEHRPPRSCSDLEYDVVVTLFQECGATGEGDSYWRETSRRPWSVREPINTRSIGPVWQIFPRQPVRGQTSTSERIYINFLILERSTIALSPRLVLSEWWCKFP